MLTIDKEKIYMQTAERFATNEPTLEELIKKNTKLERIAEAAAQLRDTFKDVFASYNEKEYVVEKLGESIEEYELFLEGY
jgi:cytochrome c peroxidase